MEMKFKNWPLVVLDILSHLCCVLAGIALVAGLVIAGWGAIAGHYQALALLWVFLASALGLFVAGALLAIPVNISDQLASIEKKLTTIMRRDDRVEARP